MESNTPSPVSLNIDNEEGFALPDETSVASWIETALVNKLPPVAVTIVALNKDDMQAYNQRFRGKAKPTNILSFPADIDIGLDVTPLGDILICPELIAEEASKAQKDLRFHYAHLIVHGTLHLQGFDHQTLSDAEIMQTHEIACLTKLGFPNPYGETREQPA